MSAKQFTATLTRDARRRSIVSVPFDPDETWGRKPKHHVRGSIDGVAMRAVVQRTDDGHAIVLGPAWSRDCGLKPGARVKVVLEPEGPQRQDLAPDIAAALSASPKAAEFFDSLAQFYRKGFLRWIDATKRSPETRAARIAEMVQLLEQGRKERPRS